MSARCALLYRLLASTAACLIAVAAASSPPPSAALPRRLPPLTPPPGRTGPSRKTPGAWCLARTSSSASRTPSDSQSLPLGNGSLGVAAWAAGGFTAQLNRSDTMPYRLSPGQVQIPGLAAMTSASNFTGTLDLYNGVLDESGGGMTMQAWVPAGKDELIVNVTGANPSTQADRRPAPVERAQPHRGRVRRDRQPRPDLGGQLPDGLVRADIRRDERDHRGRAERDRVGGQLHRGAGLLHPELQRLVPGGHRVARVDRRQRDHHRLEPDRQRHHRRRVVAAVHPVVLVERLLGEQPG